MVACSNKESKEDNPEHFQNYIEKTISKTTNPIHLPDIENGLIFKPADSVYYLNLFLPNDSTIEIDNETYIYSLDSIFGVRRYWYERDKDTLNQIKRVIANKLKKVEAGNIEINFFCDSNLHMKLFEKVKDLLAELSNDSIRYLNIMGNTGRYVQVNYSKEIKSDITCFMPKTRNILEILVNNKNDLMIEGEWDISYDSIPHYIKNYYLNPNNEEDYPDLDVYTKSLILERIVIFKKFKEDAKKGKRYDDKINELNYKLSIYKLLGEYRILPKSTFIYIQTDYQTKYSFYTKILNEINRTVLSIKDKYVRDGFYLSYHQLLQGNHYKKLREAVDFIFPNKIYPLKALEPIPVELIEDANE